MSLDTRTETIDIDMERLVQLGSVQIGPDFLPRDFGDFFSWMDDGEQLDAPTYIEVLKLYHPKLEEAIRGILVLAGFDPEGHHTLKRSVRHQKKKITNWHQDYDGTRTGFSILISGTDQPGFNGVMAAGRRSKADFHNILSYDYQQGPVVIAQKGFTIPAIPSGSDLLATWHSSARSMDADFVGIDVLCDWPGNVILD